jgi:hypothetical protein
MCVLLNFFLPSETKFTWLGVRTFACIHKAADAGDEISLLFLETWVGLHDS